MLVPNAIKSTITGKASRDICKFIRDDTTFIVNSAKKGLMTKEITSCTWTSTRVLCINATFVQSHLEQPVSEITTFRCIQVYTGLSVTCVTRGLTLGWDTRNT